MNLIINVHSCILFTFARISVLIDCLIVWKGIDDVTLILLKKVFYLLLFAQSTVTFLL